MRKTLLLLLIFTLTNSCEIEKHEELIIENLQEQEVITIGKLKSGLITKLDKTLNNTAKGETFKNKFGIPVLNEHFFVKFKVDDPYIMVIPMETKENVSSNNMIIAYVDNEKPSYKIIKNEIYDESTLSYTQKIISEKIDFIFDAKTNIDDQKSIN